MTEATTIRLPLTKTRRGGKTWIKMLSHVEPTAQNGHGFHGPFKSPGQLCNVSDITSPILLECAGNDGSAKHMSILYVLWKLNGTEWEKIAECDDREWAFHLRGFAIEALAALQPPELAPGESSSPHELPRVGSTGMSPDGTLHFVEIMRGKEVMTRLAGGSLRDVRFNVLGFFTLLGVSEEYRKEQLDKIDLAFNSQLTYHENRR